MNIKQLMKQAQQMQDQMQRQMATIHVEGTAGGGMVKAEMNGNKELLAITIDKEAVDPEDVEMLQDMVLAAVNEGIRAAQERAEAKMGGIAGGMGGMGGGLGLPGM